MKPQLQASLLMMGSSFLFAVMGVCVKLASARYGSGEIVFYRGLVGALFITGLVFWRGGSLRTGTPPCTWDAASGVCALVLWFYAIGQLPLATAITLNYMSSIWMALFLIGGAVLVGSSQRVDLRLVLAVLTGFGGVALVLRPPSRGSSGPAPWPGSSPG
jgi:S-adenosylmethionine uptake transporter